MQNETFIKQLSVSILVYLAGLPLAAQVVSNGLTAASSSAWDFSGATSLKVPLSSGAAPTLDGLLSFDSIAHNFVWGSNGATKTGATKSGATVAGDCAQWDANGNVVDSGAACGSGGGGGGITSVTGTSPVLSSGGATPAISCPTCVTSAAALSALSLVAGSGAQGSQATNISTDSGLNNLSVPGTITTGTASGAPHGKIAMQELPANGTTTAGWESQDTITASLSLRFPNANPAANQFMLFPAPTSGVAEWTWTTFSSTNLTDTANLIRNSTSAAGDVSGTFPTLTVAKVNGTTYPSGGSLTTNTVPVVTGAGAVTYEAVPNAALANSSITVTPSAPLTGGGATALGATATLACATCVTASTPGAGIGHFAGSTQALTSSAVVEADITLAANTTNNVSTSKHGFAPILPNDATKYLDGTGAYSGMTHSIAFSVDGGGSVIATGDIGQYPTAAFACTINRIDISGTPSGSVAVDVWKAAGAVPTSGNKISASAPLTLSSSQLSQNGSRTGWTNTVSVGDVFGFSVASATTVTKISGQIWCQ